MSDEKPPVAQSDPRMISMQELDPSPVDESPPVDEVDPEKGILPDEDGYFRRPPYSTSGSTSNVGLSSSSVPRVLQALQKYSTIPPSIYLALHYTNTALIPAFTRSVKKSDDLLLLTRPYYQSPVLEPLLILAPIATHIISGVGLRLYRRRQIAIRHGAESFSDWRRIPWPKVSVQSTLGYFLLPLYAGHVFVNRILPLKEEGGSSGVGLRYVAHGFARHPVIANLGYGALVCVASWHFVGGAAKWLKLSSEFVTESGDYGLSKRKSRRWIINGISCAVAAVWMLGGLGVVGRGGAGTGWEAKGWDELYKKVPIVGQWI